MAGVEGIEPSSAVLETDVLPLNYTPISKRVVIIQERTAVVKLFFAVFEVFEDRPSGSSIVSVKIALFSSKYNLTILLRLYFFGYKIVFR